MPAEARVYDVVANTADQLYLGYNSELTLPRVAKAAQDTYGLMVTYNSKPVVTPYFGHSAGQTLTWKKVWGGADKPWLKSVSAFYDTGENYMVMAWACPLKMLPAGPVKTAGLTTSF